MAQPSFKTDILPLFTQTDLDHMRAFGVDLDDYTYMSTPANAETVYELVSSGRMPPGDPWPEAQVALFKAWVDGGFKP